MSREPNGLKVMADAIAGRFTVGQAVEWDVVRDVADLHSGGDLHPVKLDILTDMIIKRIKAVRK